MVEGPKIEDFLELGPEDEIRPGMRERLVARVKNYFSGRRKTIDGELKELEGVEFPANKEGHAEEAETTEKPIDASGILFFLSKQKRKIRYEKKKEKLKETLAEVSEEFKTAKEYLFKRDADIKERLKMAGMHAGSGAYKLIEAYNQLPFRYKMYVSVVLLGGGGFAFATGSAAVGAGVGGLALARKIAASAGAWVGTEAAVEHIRQSREKPDRERTTKGAALKYATASAIAGATFLGIPGVAMHEGMEVTGKWLGKMLGYTAGKQWSPKIPLVGELQTAKTPPRWSPKIPFVGELPSTVSAEIPESDYYPETAGMQPVEPAAATPDASTIPESDYYPETAGMQPVEPAPTSPASPEIRERDFYPETAGGEDVVGSTSDVAAAVSSEVSAFDYRELAKTVEVRTGRGYEDMLTRLRHEMLPHKAEILAQYGGDITKAPADIQAILNGNIHALGSQMTETYGKIVPLHSTLGITADGHFRFDAAPPVSAHALEIPEHDAAVPEAATGAAPEAPHVSAETITAHLNQWHLEHPEAGDVRVDIDAEGNVTGVHDAAPNTSAPIDGGEQEIPSGAVDRASGGSFDTAWSPGASALPHEATLFKMADGYYVHASTPGESFVYAQNLASAKGIPVFFDNSGIDANGTFTPRVGKIEPNIFGGARIIDQVLGANGQPLARVESAALLKKIILT
ncbi:hypothetical protein A3D11_01675 [Candidatus Peribacteria bacterium RIFCSPHIGHO2_02_FULL_49_16]|nr:MAG: hypothetical protein A3D11_01675 [Candidatus Peribacteria bacterium RIFCSPHIGHO2_02_FULL_49_16]